MEENGKEDNENVTTLTVSSASQLSIQRRPSAIFQARTRKRLKSGITKKYRPQYRLFKMIGNVLETLAIVAALGASIWLIIERKDWTDSLFENEIVLYWVWVTFAFIIRCGAFISVCTKFAKKNLSQERYLAINSCASTFFTLHLLPLVMIDDNWDPINPIFDESYYKFQYGQITALVIYGLLIILWIVLLIIGRRIEHEHSLKFQLILSTLFKVASWALFIVGFFAIFILFTAMLSFIPLIYIEIWSSFYYLTRTLITAYRNNKLCLKPHKKPEIDYDFRKSQSLEKEKPTTECELTGEDHQPKQMSRYRSLEVKPSIPPMQPDELPDLEIVSNREDELPDLGIVSKREDELPDLGVVSNRE